MKISLIAAIAENGVIGNKNTIPWKCSEDMKFFKKTTIGNGNNAVLMGRKTWDSLGKWRPLPDRDNIVVSKNIMALDVVRGMNGTGEIEYALDWSKMRDNLFIIGGASIYEQTWHLCEDLYISRIKQSPEGDCKFPDVDWSMFEMVTFEDTPEVVFEYYRRKGC